MQTNSVTRALVNLRYNNITWLYSNIYVEITQQLNTLNVKCNGINTRHCRSCHKHIGFIMDGFLEVTSLTGINSCVHLVSSWPRVSQCIRHCAVRLRNWLQISTCSSSYKNCNRWDDDSSISCTSDKRTPTTKSATQTLWNEQQIRRCRQIGIKEVEC